MKITNNYISFREKASFSLSKEYNLASENLPWVKSPKLSSLPIVFYNKCKMYFDESSLPPSCVDVTDLSNKYVLYGIYCNNKHYVGATTDFGERMSTHIMDSKKDKKTQLLYPSMVKAKECFCFVLGIVDTKEILTNAEHTLIKVCKDFSIGKCCNFDETKIKFIKESARDSKKYASRYCYNIID